MTEQITLCLGHEIHADRPNGCPKANQCERHVALRAPEFPDSATITGAACASNDFLLFLPIQQIVNNAE